MTNYFDATCDIAPSRKITPTSRDKLLRMRVISLDSWVYIATLWVSYLDKYWCNVCKVPQKHICNRS